MLCWLCKALGRHESLFVAGEFVHGWMLRVEVDGLDAWERVTSVEFELQNDVPGQCSILSDLGSWFHSKGNASEACFRKPQDEPFADTVRRILKREGFDVFQFQKINHLGRSCLSSPWNDGKGCVFVICRVTLYRDGACWSRRLLVTQRSWNKDLERDLAQVVLQDPDATQTYRAIGFWCTCSKKDPGAEILT